MQEQCNAGTKQHKTKLFKLKTMQRTKTTFQLPKLQLKGVKFTVQGTTPLLVDNPSGTKVPSTKISGAKPLTDSQKEEMFQNSIYFLPDLETQGIPVSWLKNSFRDGKSGVYSPKMLSKRMVMGGLKIKDTEAELIAFDYSGPEIFYNTVQKAAGGGIIHKVRAMYPEWSIDIECLFDEEILDVQGVLSVFQTVGIKYGIGSWRTGGFYGQFRILTENIETFNKEIL